MPLEVSMVLRVKVSRDGLTRCPKCSSHIKVAAVLAETTCPFCNTVLKTALKPDPKGILQSISDKLKQGRGGLIAASLLGLTAGVSGCATDSNGDGTGGDTSSITDVVQEDAEDVGAQPEYGVPADVFQEDAMDAGPQPEYGVPADVDEEKDEGATTANDVEREDATDAGPQPEYGVPADAEEEKDEGATP
jgi:hypothetical protein